MSRLGRAALNRTLLHRQHLLERVAADPVDEVAHLVGLQAQATMPPFLGLAARLASFDPTDVDAGLHDRRLVRALSLRNTVHLHTAEDARSLLGWTGALREREVRMSQNIGAARDVDRTAFARAVRDALDAGPLGVGALGDLLAARFPGHDPRGLGQLARTTEHLVQVPPRGTWRGAGGVVYQHVDRWLGADETEPDVPALVRRYLRAYGPATAADVTTWSGVTRLGPVLAGMDDLVHHEDERGRRLLDVPDGVLVPADAPAPVRLLGVYDEVWLAHADRDRVTEPERRAQWSGPNGGSACAILVDGWLEGFWKVVDGRVGAVDVVGRLSRAQRSDLDTEIDRTNALLAH